MYNHLLPWLQEYDEGCISGNGIDLFFMMPQAYEHHSASSLHSLTDYFFITVTKDLQETTWERFISGLVSGGSVYCGVEGGTFHTMVMGHVEKPLTPR